MSLADMSLADLEARVRHDLTLLGHGAPTWVRPRGDAYDVVIVGGGQSGLGAAFALQRERITNILVIDENPAGYEGPWDTYARMVTLRTPKGLTGIDLGIPSLTFRAFEEARRGPAAWDAIDKIPRRDWMEYLRWYRRVTDLPVRNETRLTRIEPLGDGTHRLHLADAAPIVTRKVVLATGIQGGGEWHVPAFVRDALPKALYAHTSEPIDYAALKGGRIAILGGGASAFDNAQAALGAGVAQAHVHLRRREMPRVNPIRFMEASGLSSRHAGLSDADRHAVMASFFERNQPPTNDTFARAAAYPGFALRLGAPWLAVREEGGRAVVTTPQGEAAYDLLVLSTGLVTDPRLRPELGALADDIMRWGERRAAPAPHALIDAHPYLGRGFELLGRDAGGSARLHGLFAFNYSALVSQGLSAAALSGLRHALPRLVEGIAGQLFMDDRETILGDYFAFAEPEFTADLKTETAA